MKESLLILAAALAMVSCGGNAQQKAATAGTQQTTAAAPDMHNAETSLDYLGVYKGTLPAADCPGIETTLTLAPDGSYALHLKYIDRDSEFDEKGAFTCSRTGHTMATFDDIARLQKNISCPGGLRPPRLALCQCPYETENP